ncbi:MAG TPA: GntR family transcriptional regulator [Stellaceae bacterium]|nr:GntR family transcriptional regulator [Stellaceae bacterium]
MPPGGRIVLKLRELILSGALPPGQRVGEVALAERLGVSRTPVRHALAVLAREGLLTAAGARGFLVREFTLKDILDAIELRGTLEGMAARLVAEAGLDSEVERRLEACLAEGEAILRDADWPADGDQRWAGMNELFHRLIVEAAGNQALTHALSFNDTLPFASAGALLGGDSEDDALRRRHRDVLARAQQQHRAILDALRQRQGARAEALMREHALAARDNNVLFQSRIPAIAERRPAAVPIALRM